MEETLKSLSMDYLNLLINGQAFSDVTFSVEGRLFLYSGQVSLVPQKGEPRPGCGERGCWHTHCAAAVDLALDTLAAARSFGVEELALLTQKQLAGMVEKASIEDVMKVLMASRKQDLHQLWTTCSHLVAKSGLPPEVLAKHLPIDVVAKIDELRLKSMSRRSPFLSHHHPHHPAGIEAPTAELDDHHKIRRMRRALDSSDVELVKLMVMGEGLNLDEALALHYAVENCSREVVKALLELGAADVNHPAGPAGKTPLHVAAEMVCPDMVAVLLDHHADPNVRTVDGVTPLDILRTLTSDFLFKGAVPGLAHIEPNKLRLCLELVQSAAMVMSREDAQTAVNAAPIYGESPAGGGGVDNARGTNPSMVANKLRLCLELVQSAAMVMSREDAQTAVNAAPIYGESPPGGGGVYNASGTNSSMVNLSLDNRMVYLNLGMDAQFGKMNDGSDGDDGGSRGHGGPSSLFSPHGFP
uniref:C2HC NPR-type domain-containing protein n=1 Tax=Oryza brachyantha TaxID=4533 RepID=J3L7U1_ORYBR